LVNIITINILNKTIKESTKKSIKMIETLI